MITFCSWHFYLGLIVSIAENPYSCGYCKTRTTFFLLKTSNARWLLKIIKCSLIFFHSCFFFFFLTNERRTYWRRCFMTNGFCFKIRTWLICVCCTSILLHVLFPFQTGAWYLLVRIERLNKKQSTEYLTGSMIGKDRWINLYN